MRDDIIQLPSQSTSLAFGSFRVFPLERLLFEESRRVAIGGRAFDLLLCLIARPGELITKQELMERVWPGLAVEEVNLRVNIGALRQALGDGRNGCRHIETTSGRGYRFASPVTTIPTAQPMADPTKKLEMRSPARAVPLIGRDETLDSIMLQLSQRRLVTIVGPGGIGKTAVALTVAERMNSAFIDGVCMVDLSTQLGPGGVPAAAAFSLGLSNLSDDPTPGIIASLREKEILLIFDSCEANLKDAALLGQQLLDRTISIKILATSREPLRASGEQVKRLDPLGVPPVGKALTLAHALTYPSVQLFLARATATNDSFNLSEADAPIVARVCSRLDGIPLALELVAGHVAAFDLRSLAALLDDQFRLFAHGRRTDVPRHHTLNAVLDWSYELLSDDERGVLRRLAVFDGSITLEGIKAVAGEAGLSSHKLISCVGSLVDKSLVSAEITDMGVHYCLLDTTRHYAFERLAESGEHLEVSRRHANHYLLVFELAEKDRLEKSHAEWLRCFGRQIGNLRVALDWAFSPEGDVTLAVALSGAVVPLMLEISSASEVRRRVTQVLALLELVPSENRMLELRLRATLGAVHIYTAGLNDQLLKTWDDLLQLATAVDNLEFKARALWGLWLAYIFSGEPRKALVFAERFLELSIQSGDKTKILIGWRLTGTAYHYLGQQAVASQKIRAMLEQYVPSSHHWHTMGYRVDHALTAQASLARITWLEGRADEAMQLAERTLAKAKEQSYGISVCYVLIEAVIPIAVLRGDTSTAKQALATLLEYSALLGLSIWEVAGRCISFALPTETGARPTGDECRAALLNLRSTGYTAPLAWLSGELGLAMAKLGDRTGGQALVDEAIAKCERSGEEWCIAELWRIKGELVEVTGSKEAATRAARYFIQAMDISRVQGSLSWELRAATSLARLYRQQDRPDDARSLLQAILSRFSEGFTTTDLVEAKQLLSQLPA